MKLLYTRNKLPLSVLIRWGLSEPVSHVAIEFDSKIVFHSNLSGVHLTFASTFRKKNEIVFEQDLQTTEEEENQSYFEVISKREGNPYDFLAFIYWAYCVIKFKLFKADFPEVNRLKQKHADLCVELVDTIPERFNTKNLDLAIVSPFQLFCFMQKQLKK